MNVRRVKQLVGLVGAWIALTVVVATIGIAALSVIATSSGADPALAFTDPAGLLLEPQVEWVENDQGRQLQHSARARIEAVWNSALTTRIVQSTSGETAVGSSLVEAQFATVGLEFVQVRGEVALARTVEGKTVVTTEIFEAALAQQPSGWVVLSMQRLSA